MRTQPTPGAEAHRPEITPAPGFAPTESLHTHLKSLNPAQRRAVLFGLAASESDGAGAGVTADPTDCPPLLIIAGAGTGKTMTLAHRVAELVLCGVDSGRILLLTFTRRAAREMTRRAERIVAQAVRAERKIGAGRSGRRAAAGSLRSAGTFHAMASRLLRLYAPALGLDPSFTILDRSDAEDLLDVVRHQSGLSRQRKRFPRKGTCLAIYSRCVNSGDALQKCLDDTFPWCSDWEEELRELFRGYVDCFFDLADQ